MSISRHSNSHTANHRKTPEYTGTREGSMWRSRNSRAWSRGQREYGDFRAVSRDETSPRVAPDDRPVPPV